MLDLAFRLYNPGRSFLALLIGGLALLSGLLPNSLLWPWQVLTAVALVVVLVPIVFLVREGVAARYVVRYPLVAIIALLWLPIRIVSRFTSKWARTQHSG